MDKNLFLEKIKSQLIVSCQAVDDEPLNNVIAITLMAKSVIEGGAKVLRLSQIEHIKSIKTITNLPIIGLIKRKYNDSEVYITPTIKEIDELANLNIDCIALDATNRKRPHQTLKEIVDYCKNKYPKISLMADCATIEDVKNANDLEFDLVGTTLRGYTRETKNLNNIDNNYEFIREVIKISTIPVIAEGGINEPYQVKELLNLNVHAVVVGSAITRPKEITKKFLKAIEN